MTFSKRIYESSEVIFELTSDLLLWSRSQMDNIKLSYNLYNINDIIDANIKLAKVQAVSKQITISNQCEINKCLLSLDKDLISTVIRNLISNALKFTNTNGKVSLFYFMNEDNIVVTVKDNGVGIAKEAQSKIFHDSTDYITKGTNNEHGTGLGLLICNDFITMHNARIWVNSEVETGTEICFSLPITQANSTQSFNR